MSLQVWDQSNRDKLKEASNWSPKLSKSSKVHQLLPKTPQFMQKASLCMKSTKQTKIYEEKKENKEFIDYKRGENKGKKGENH